MAKSKLPPVMQYVSMTYRELVTMVEETTAIDLLRIAGVATEHRVFMLHGEQDGYDRLVYIVTPESGPADYILNRFPNEKRDLSAWTLPPYKGAPDYEDWCKETDRITSYVLHYVVDQAQQEVKDNR